MEQSKFERACDIYRKIIAETDPWSEERRDRINKLRCGDLTDYSIK